VCSNEKRDCVIYRITYSSVAEKENGKKNWKKHIPYIYTKFIES